MSKIIILLLMTRRLRKNKFVFKLKKIMAEMVCAKRRKINRLTRLVDYLKSAFMRFFKIIKSQPSHIFGIVISFFVCFSYAMILSNKGMSIAEGWYTTFAELINEKGCVPYRDFELIFPPLYVYIIALFTKIFGYEIIFLRILGAFIFAFSGLFLYLIFKKIIKNTTVSLILGIMVAGFMQSEVVQVFYDYIRFMDLFVFVSIYFYLRFIDEQKKEKKRRVSVNLITSVVFASFASLIKQSSGLLYLISVLCMTFLLCIFAKNKKEWLTHAIVCFVTFISIYLVTWIMLALASALGDYFYYNFFASVGAKGGGLYEILFGFLKRGKEGLASATIPVLAVIFFVLDEIFITRSKKANYAYGEKFAVLGCISVAIFFALSFLMIVKCLFFANDLQIFNVTVLLNTAFVTNLIFTLVAFFALCYYKRKKVEISNDLIKYFVLSFSSLILSYAVCMSSGLTQGEVALSVGVMFLTMIYFSKYVAKEIVCVLLSVVVLFIANSSFAFKINNIYAWWDINLGSYKEQVYTSSVPLLKDIKMNENYARMYDGVYKLVLENTTDEDAIFTFPHVPIFYTMTGRYSNTYSLVQWIDVTNDKTIEKDIKVLEKNLPKMMILSIISEYTLSSHENMFRKGEESGTRIMQEYLINLAEEKYELLEEYLLNGSNGIAVYLLKESV